MLIIAIFLVIIVVLVPWWIIYVKSDDGPIWKLIYAFWNWFMILFLVGFFLLGPIIGTYSASESALNDLSPWPYWSEFFWKMIKTGLILGFLSGITALLKELKARANTKKS